MAGDTDYPLFSVGSFAFSGRDLILLIGGLFLLFKATMELHERLEGAHLTATGPRVYAGFWAVIAQIVVLDAVFSLDAVITAVGMVDQLAVMMAAVIIAMGVMLLASKPLTRFVNNHPTVVVLCLSFLLMIGFSLVAEGLGFKVPKGYLYAAIGFSILIEFFNQWARRNSARHESRMPLRDRTAEAVLRLLGHKRRERDAEETKEEALHTPEVQAFGVEERNMVSGVLSLAERSIRSIMTPRTDLSWVNLDDDVATIRQLIADVPHSFFPVCRGSIDEIVGVARAKDLIEDLLTIGHIDLERSLRQPIIVHESVGVLAVMETLRRASGQLALVTDEFGAVQGLVTPIDVFEAIAGEFPDEDETPDIVAEGENRWRVNGAADLHYLEQVLQTEWLLDEADGYATLAGYLLNQFGELPVAGAALVRHEVRFEILQVAERRIAEVAISKVTPDAEPDGSDSTDTAR